MIAFDPQTTTVILAACSGLALGVAGMRIVDATADWRMLSRHRRRAKRAVRDFGSNTPRQLPWAVPELARPAPVSLSAPGLPAGVRAAPTRVQAQPTRVPVYGGTESARPPPVPVTVASTFATPPPLPQQDNSRVLPRSLIDERASETSSARVLRSPETPAWQTLGAVAPRSESATPTRYPAPHLQMRAIDHVTEFVEFQRDRTLGKNPRTGRWECRRSTADVLEAYRLWARARSLVVIPEWQFLNLLCEQPSVEKSRDRLKDRNGRVLRNEHGTPLRTHYYTICELPEQRVYAPLRKTG